MSYFIIDIVLVLFLVLGAYLGHREGFLKTLVRLAGWILALWAAAKFSSAIADYIYVHYIKDELLRAITNAIVADTAGGTEILSFHLPAFMESLAQMPEFLRNIITLNADKISDTLNLAISQTGRSAAQAIVSTVLGPMVTGVLRGAVFAVLFVVCRLLVTLLTKVLSIVDYIPVVAQINGVLGAGAGLVNALLKVFVFAAVFQIVVVFTNGSIPLFSKQALEATVLFKHFVYNNFILGIL